MCMARPDQVNDLQVSWAIREIPPSILEFKYKGLLWGLLSIIGNKLSCRYSQPQLADILGVSERQLQYLLAHLKDKKFIFIKEPKVKGRGYGNEYFLNYTLILSFENKHAQFASLEDESTQSMRPLDDKRTQKTSKKDAQFAYPRKTRDIHKSRERRAREKTARPARASRLPLSENFKADEQNQKRLAEASNRSGKSQDDLLRTFRNIQKSKEKVSADWQAELETFLMNERPAGFGLVTNRLEKPEVKNTVPFWGPGHPGWESLHGKKQANTS